MRSFKHKPDNRRQVYLALAGSIENQLREAYAKRNEAGLETQASLGAKLGVGRAAINRRLTGRQKNMTIETVADMVWGLGQCVKVHIYDPADVQTNDHQIVPQHTSNQQPATAPTPELRFDKRAVVSGGAESPNRIVQAVSV